MFEIKQHINFLPVHIVDPRIDKQESVYIGEELESLIQTFGGEIIDRLIQKIVRPHNATYIGAGKIQEIAKIIKEKDVDVVVLSAMLKPGQVHTIREILALENPEIQVWDRIDLILHIFEKHASTTEAKLQIELARMKYMGPRIYGMGMVMSRQGGGIGTMGIGETNTELMKRHWRNETKRVTDQLEKISKTRQDQLDRRRKAGFKTVSIVGYTNAGKSSLFNILTGKKNYAKNELFATLDSTIGSLFIKDLGQEVLITDTIGFIRDLPPLLISAFKSTLMETIHADVLLHIVDIADPELEKKIKVVDAILRELQVESDRVVYIFNKTDMITTERADQILEQYKELSPLPISVKNGSGIIELKDFVTVKLQ